MKKFIFFIKIFIFIFISVSISVLGFYLYAYITPKINLYNNNILIYDNNDDLVYGNELQSDWVKLDDISKFVKNATISAEDKNFYKHEGFDYPRIVKAMWLNIKAKKIVQGASTISQQYIKNLFLDFDQTWSRKIEEAYLTFELEVHYTKDEILEGYLNTINYGAGNYGIENAANYYFGKNAKDLSLSESTILVGIPKNPTYYNPVTNYKNAKVIQKDILNSMVKNKYITKNQAVEAFNENLIFYAKKDNKELSSLNYYFDAVKKELNNINVPQSLIETGGLKIYTNLDLQTQIKLENIINQELTKKDLQVATVAIDPKTGKVLALIGGNDYNKTQYNRVTQSKRQVGSTIKPILYYSALENGFTPSTTFSSEKTIFNLGNNKTYSPKNYGNIYPNKNISLAMAIATSDNIYAVKTHLFLGPETLINTADRFGIKENLKDTVSEALGTTEINMLDFSTAYSTLANSGIKKESYLIEKVTDMNNNILYEKKHKEERVLNEKYTYILNELLTNTYNYNFVDYTTPTMLGIKSNLTKKYSVKSGSTTTDCWTIGYNPDILLMVWNGYDDNKSVNSSVSFITKNIWAKGIESILKHKNSVWYEIPNNVTASIVDSVSGEYNNTNKNALLYYVKGTEPSIKNSTFDSIFFNTKN